MSRDLPRPTEDRLARFLYLLARDHLPTGEIEKILAEHIESADVGMMSSGHLLKLAESWAERLRGPTL